MNMTKVIYNSKEDMIVAVKRAIARKKQWEETARNNYISDCERIGMPVVL